jgi:hypothetical protein
VQGIIDAGQGAGWSLRTQFHEMLLQLTTMFVVSWEGKAIGIPAVALSDCPMSFLRKALITFLPAFSYVSP